MTEKEIQAEINELTIELKTMSSDDPLYAAAWNRRAELKWQLYDLRNTK